MTLKKLMRSRDVLVHVNPGDVTCKQKVFADRRLIRRPDGSMWSQVVWLFRGEVLAEALVAHRIA